MAIFSFEEASAPVKATTFSFEEAIGAKPSTVAERIGTGVMDPIHGGAQLLTHLLPDSAVQKVTELNNWLREQGLPLAEIPKGGLDQMVSQREKDYAASRAAAGSEGIDWARMAGNVASPANIAAAGVPVAGATLGARALSGIASGAAMGAMSPTEGDFGIEKAKQIGLGAMVGAVTPAIAGGAARVIKPNIAPDIQKLADAGVQMTPGQMAGGMAKRMEDAAVSVPLLGDVIKSAQNRSIASFDRSVINKSLEPIGEKLPGDLKGHKAVEYAAERVSDAYDGLLSKMAGERTPEFVAAVENVRQMGKKGLAPLQAGELGRIIDNEVLGRFTEGGRISGETVKEIESELGNIARQSMRSESYDTRKVGKAAQELQSSLRDMLEQVNPEYAPQLQAVNTAYARLLRPQGAAASAGALRNEGVFTPAQLLSSIRGLDPSKRKAAVAKGTALGQDFAETAARTLSPTVADSGTPIRLMVANAMRDPLRAGVAAIPAALATIPYSESGNALARMLMLSRPETANALAQLVRRTGKYGAPAGVSALNQIEQP